MHEERRGLGAAALEEVLSDLEARKVSQAALALLLLTHRDPGVGDDYVGALDGLLGRVGVQDQACGGLALDALLGTREDLAVELVALRSGDLKVDANARVGDEHLVEDVVRVADPGHCQARERAKVGREGTVELEQGLQVGKDLRWVVLVAERVDHWHARVLCKLLDIRMRANTSHDAVDHARDNL